MYRHSGALNCIRNGMREVWERPSFDPWQNAIDF